MTGTGTVDNTNIGLANFTVGGANATSTFNGTIKNSGLGALSLMKIGSGDITIAGQTDYNRPHMGHGRKPDVEERRPAFVLLLGEDQWNVEISTAQR